MQKPIVEMYAVQSNDGKWLRRKGYGGHGDSWVDDIKKARIYTKIGQARSQVTFWSEHYPQYGVPSIVKLTVSAVEVLDESERVTKSIQKKKEAKEIRVINQHQEEVEKLQQTIENAKNRLKTMKNQSGVVLG